MLVTLADVIMSSSSEDEEVPEMEVGEALSDSGDEDEKPSIEVVDADDDLSAVVDEAMDHSQEEEVESNSEIDDVGTNEAETVRNFLNRWWKSDDSHLAATIPEFSFLSKVEVIRGIIILSVSTLFLQLWNMLFGLATSGSGSRENTINWWDYFFVSGADSSLAPEFSDPLGWVLLIIAACILISTMPRHPKD